MLKIINKTILRTLIKFLYIFYNYHINSKIKNSKNLIYSYWIRNEFKKCGDEILIQAPAFIKGGKYISIGDGFNSLENLRLECWNKYDDEIYKPKIQIGNNVIMNKNVHIGCINQVIIGNNVLFGSNIMITDHQHGFVDYRDLSTAPNKRPLSSNGPVIIEDNVWIGENVSIMPNVKIEVGCIIGANSVVTKSFAKNSVIAGVPAKFIRTLNID